MPNLIVLPTASVLLLYTPSLIGLLFAIHQLLSIFYLARKRKSTAASFLLSMLSLGVGIFISWFVIVGIANTLVNLQYSLFDWRIALLPIMWVMILFFINKEMRK